MNDITKYVEKFGDYAADLLPKIVGSLILLVVGLWFIKVFTKLMKKAFLRRGFDESVSKFLMDMMKWGLRVLLFVIVASQLGIKTTSFVAILGAAGLAIGMALQGSLANFAGGVLILIFKPFKVGDYINAQGTFGTVKAITIFTTTLTTDLNQLAIIPNGQLSNEKIINYSTLPERTEAMTFNIHALDNLELAKETILKEAMQHPLVIKDENSQPKVMVKELAGATVTLQLLYKTKTANFWAAHWDIIESVKIELGKAGMNGFVPVQEVRVIEKK